jgi:hypothetical protein
MKYEYICYGRKLTRENVIEMFLNRIGYLEWELEELKRMRDRNCSVPEMALYLEGKEKLAIRGRHYKYVNIPD